MGFSNDVQENLMNVESPADSMDIELTFSDESWISFSATSDGPDLKGSRVDGCWSSRFLDQFSAYKHLPTGVLFVFKDSTELEFGL